MRIFTTIILCIVWLSSFSQEKTIVVKKDILEIVLNDSIKNGDAINRITLEKEITISVKNSDLKVISYDIFIARRGKSLTINSNKIGGDPLYILRMNPSEQLVTIDNIFASDGESDILIGSFSFTIKD
jgi:hypothetical protein